ncbi:MAG: sensor histidine kinase [Halobacteriales archaeon]
MSRSWTDQHALAQGAMTLLWAGFTAAYMLFFYAFQDVGEIADASLDGYLEVILLGIPTVVLLAAVMWLRESAVDADLQPRLVGWVVGATLAFVLAIHAALFVIEPRFDAGERWLMLLLSGGFGASSGTVMGLLELRSSQRERERNRSIRVARRKERERSQLEYLNQYLRHEVLNEAAKISGYASLLSDQAHVEQTDHIEVIRDSSEEIAEFIESIRTILDAADHDPELTALDLVSVVETEIEAIRRAHGNVGISLDGSDTANVLAGDLVDRAIRNLIENAIEHNDGAVSVDVSVRTGEEWVRLRVRDDGSGIPADQRDQLFEPPETGDHGYGLFLTRNLVEVYGGRIELEGTGPDGTTFLVRFRRATGPDPGIPIEEAPSTA